jgi:hypothetical protein
MTIEKFAELFRLRIARDECGDRIIRGKRGHLYFAGSEMCLLVIDGAPLHRTRWEALGGELWIGDAASMRRGGAFKTSGSRAFRLKTPERRSSWYSLARGVCSPRRNARCFWPGAQKAG